MYSACCGQLMPKTRAITEISSLLRRFCACSRSASATACGAPPEAWYASIACCAGAQKSRRRRDKAEQPAHIFLCPYLPHPAHLIVSSVHIKHDARFKPLARHVCHGWLFPHEELPFGGWKVEATCMAAEGSMTSQSPSLANTATPR